MGVRHREGRRGELQRLLGDLGYVLPRQAHGTTERPAQGWYAKLDGPGEPIVFLGDYALLAANKIQELTKEASNGATKLRASRGRGNAKPARARQPST